MAVPGGREAPHRFRVLNGCNSRLLILKVVTDPQASRPASPVIAYPGEITRVRALFDLPGLYIWHCHVVEHEDNDMMRPYVIGPNPPAP